MDFDVIVMGDYCLDLIFTGLKEFPQMGAEIEAKELAMETGGACNTALALHRLGVKTAWAVEFGTDDFSRFLIDRLRAEDFPEELFSFTRGSMRKITVSLSYPKDRAFIAYYDKGNMLETAFKALIKKTAKIVVIPALLYGPAMAAGSVLTRFHGTSLFMDGNSSDDITIDNLQVRKAIQKVRFYSPNCREAKAITRLGSAEEAVKELGKLCQTVIVKDGENGSWCSDNNNIIHEPAYKVKVVDTTGAGDCFNAGFIRAWLDGKDISMCLRWGNIAGALSTQRAGGNGYRLSVKEISEKAEKVK